MHSQRREGERRQSDNALKLIMRDNYHDNKALSQRHSKTPRLESVMTDTVFGNETVAVPVSGEGGPGSGARRGYRHAGLVWLDADVRLITYRLIDPEMDGIRTRGVLRGYECNGWT